MARYNWTAKRKVALECLVMAGGNVRLAAVKSREFIPQVSESYLNDLKYENEHRPFREEFYRRTKELLNAMEVDTQFVIQGLVEAANGFPAPQRVQALKLLGDYLGIWAPEKREVSIEVIHRAKELGLDVEEVIAEAERIIRDGYSNGGDPASD